MSELPSPTLGEQSRTVTPEYAGRALFLSFRFSQGEVPLQHLMFKYLHTVRPELGNDDSQFSTAVFRSAKNLVTRTVSDPDKHAVGWEDKVNYELSRMYKKMRQPNNKEGNDEENTRETLIPNITNLMLDKDLEYVAKGRSRSGTSNTKPQADPHSSFIIDYGFRGIHTGVAEYDQMFNEIREFIQKQKEEETKLWKDNLGSKFTNLVNVYNEHHPENTVKNY